MLALKDQKREEKENELCGKLLLGRCVISFYLSSPPAFLLYAELHVEPVLGGEVEAGSAGWGGGWQCWMQRRLGREKETVSAGWGGGGWQCWVGRRLGREEEAGSAGCGGGWVGRRRLAVLGGEEAG